MSDKDEELMRRYIYEVVRHLPIKQRDEISMELEELITDMYESKDGNMEEVLIELGNPKIFAKQYMNMNHYIIGPEYYDHYITIIKIVALVVGISAVFSSFFSIDPQNFELVDFIVDFFVNVLSSIFGAIGVVTFIFVMMEYYQVKVDVKSEHDLKPENQEKDRTGKDKSENTTWNPADLSPRPRKEALISRFDSLISAMIVVAVAAFVVFAPNPIGIYYKENGLVQTIPIFNMDYWNVICPIFLVAFFVSLVDEIVKVVTGCYCKLVLLCNLITNCIQLALFTVLFKFVPVWNPDFTEKLSKLWGHEINSKGDILSYWGTDVISNCVLGFIWIVTLIEIGVTVYKTLRYKCE